MKQIVSLFLAGSILLSSVGCSNTMETEREVPGQSEQAIQTGQSTPSDAALKLLSDYALVETVYPERAPYPNEMEYLNQKTGDFDDESFRKVYDAWREDLSDRRSGMDCTDALTGFLTQSIPQFLDGAAGENRVYSPLNVYMALAMLAELTDGSSRDQLLELLGSDNIHALRQQAAAVWNANYCDDGATTTILASSLWLNEGINFVQPTLDTLADTYYASAYQGAMGSKEFNKALQSWLNEQTGGLLEEQAAQIELDPETILALATTIYFRAKWSSEFSEERTEEKTFHAADGDMTCRFMHQSGTDTYYWGDQFSAISKRFEGGEAMWFLLPDEGVTPENLLEDVQVMDFLLNRSEWENSRYLIVNKAIPRFDITSQMDLREGLMALGITDVFDPEHSDFTPMTTDTDNIALSQVKHDARVTIDEDGCTAAAYTVMAMAGAAAPPKEEVDFVLDRPFLFAVTGIDGLPLFVGVVNHPI